MSNNNHVIEQIISQADIVKIIGKHTELKRAGNEFKGNCPFHGEKTPSFYVNPQKGLYKCFGCGVGGNALTFLKEYEHMTAGEALQELSRQTGIELPKERFNSAQTYKKTPNTPKSTPVQPSNIPPDHQSATNQPLPQEQLAANQDFSVNSAANPLDVDAFNHAMVAFHEANSQGSVDYQDYTNAHFAPIAPHLPAYQPDELDVSHGQADETSGNLYELLDLICQFYQSQLNQNPQACQYFEQRGLTQATIAEFALGYAPTGWQHLEQAFPNDIEGLKILGLVRTSQKGHSFDLLRHRVIFPIRDGRGRVLGFAGRALSDEDMPKYINSSDSPVFHKQQILYGLYEARKAKAEQFLVVEGYMDVISLHQAGVYGAVASMGTAIATSQIEKLLQYNPVLTLSFDGDTAGQKAAWRALEASLPTLYDGKEIRFLTLPKEHDPDSFVKAHGAGAMQDEIAKATPLSEYVFTTLSRRIPITTAEGRGKLLAELNLLIQKLPKGSYGWLLRDDIRSRMGLGKRQQARATQDALLNFTAELTPLLQLQLCFLFQPSILGTIPAISEQQPNQPTMNNELIETVFELSGATQVKYSKKEPTLSVRSPVMSFSWQDIVDDNTLALIELIQRNQTNLNEFAQHAGEISTYELINAKAHFLLVGIAPEKRAILVSHWGMFLREFAEREVVDVSDLVMEITIKLVLDGLQKRLKQHKNIAINQYIRNQIQAIFSWQKTWLEKREN